MKTVLKFDKCILVKELDDKFQKIGERYEVANILDNSFLLRDAKTKVAIGVVSFDDFEKCFVPESNFSGWTKWQQFNGFDNQNDCYYRTNRRKVQVRFITDKVRAESSKHKDDDFNLYFGIQLAYLRALNKAHAKKITKYEEELNKANLEIVENNRIMQKMINSLES